MTILLMPSLRCNLKCRYCFERPVWLSGAADLEANLDAMIGVLKRLVKEYGRGSVCLHGGEPLTLPIDKMEYLFSTIRKLGCNPSMQTNGTLITDEHIRLFKKYNVHVGVSVDGSPTVYTLRGERREIAEKVNENLLKMRRAGVSVGVLCVLHKANATGGSLGKLCNWVEWLNSLRIGGRFLIMKDFFGEAGEYELTPDELAVAWEKLYEVLRKRRAEYNWSPFRDFILSLQGRRKDAVCWMNECDPFCTKACHVILPDGSETICDRAFHMGLLLRPDSVFTIRQKILAETDCKDCPWFPDYCVGGCPLDGEDGDWRNKSKWCPAIKRMFELISKDYPPKKPVQAKPQPPRPPIRGGHGDVPHRDFSNHLDSSFR